MEPTVACTCTRTVHDFIAQHQTLPKNDELCSNTLEILLRLVFEDWIVLQDKYSDIETGTCSLYDACTFRLLLLLINNDA